MAKFPGIAMAGLLGGGVFLYGAFTGKSTLAVLQAVIKGTKPTSVPGESSLNITGGTAGESSDGSLSGALAPPAPSSVSGNVALGKMLAAQRGWGSGPEWNALYALWNRESEWETDASNPSGAYGIPQALPGNKMAAAGSDWQTNPATQIKWGLGYIAGRYSDPVGAWQHEQANGWY